MLKFIKKWYFIFVPVLVTVLALILKIVRYGAVDDILMYNIANSYDFNSHSELLMFINIDIGYLLKFLYKIIPALNWFSLVYLIFFNLAFVIYHKLIQKHEASPAFNVILAGIQFYLIMRISFTVNAFLLAGAGMLWFIEYVDKPDKKNVKHVIFSAVLFILAFSMRNNSTLYCVLLVFIPLLVFAIIKKRNAVSAVALLLVICIVSNIGVTALNRTYKKNVPEETYFNEFQQYRAEASDNGKINYKKHKDEFKKAGITKNDIDVFRQFVYGDKEAYSAEKLKAIIDSRGFGEKYNINPIKIIKNVIKLESPVLNYIFYYAVFAVILFLLFKKKRVELISSAVFLAAAELFLFIRRRGVVRVTDPIAALGIIILIYIVLNEEDIFKDIKRFENVKKEKLTALILVLVTVSTVALSGVCAHTYNKKYVDYTDTVNYIESDSDSTYLAAPLSADKLYDQHLTLLTKSYHQVPVYALEGEWNIYSYYWYAMMNKLQLNEYTGSSINAILSYNVKFVSRNKDLPDYLVKFYKEHYNIDVRYEMIGKFNGGMKIYLFSVVD